MNKSSSLGRYTQPVGGKEICILLVNDDYICRSIVSYMLNHCRFEVYNYKREIDALNIIWEKKDTLELILTNIHRIVKKSGIIDFIEKKFNLQILLMSPDVGNTKNVLRGGGNGVAVYIMKYLSVSELNDLWATALAREKGKRELVRVENVSSLVVGSETHKRKIEINDQKGNVEKKSRVVWTPGMHQKFLEAIAHLGHDKAYPKKIAELMDVPGLTRENVASHLQKYRMCMMKRAQEGFMGSYEYMDPFGFNNLQGQFQQSCLNAFKTRSINAATNHFGLDHYATNPFKPEQNFRTYGDGKKDFLVKVSSNPSFAGFRLASNGNSVEFGQNSHFDGGQIRNMNNGFIQCSSVSSDHQQYLLPELRNDIFSPCLSFLQQTDSNEVAGSPQLMSAAPWAEWAEPTRFSPQLPPSGDDSNANTKIFNDFSPTPFPQELCELGEILDDSGFDTNAISSFDDLPDLT